LTVFFLANGAGVFYRDRTQTRADLPKIRLELVFLIDLGFA